MIKEINSGIYLISYPYRLPTNSYLIGRENFILIDTNWYFEDYINFIETALSKIGRRTKDIKKVILTHFHIDHTGCASFFNDFSEILCHSKDKKYIENIQDRIDREVEFYRRNLSLWNFPKDVASSILSSVISNLNFTCKVNIKDTLKDNDILQVDDKILKIIHTPGHTEGSISVYLPDEKILFTGDTVLSYFIAFPDIYFDRNKNSKIPLLFLIDSLKKIKDLNPEMIFTGHGRKISKNNIQTTIDRNLSYYEDEIYFLTNILSKNSLTFYDIVKSILWKNNLSSTTDNIIISTIKTQNYLLILEKDGIVKRENKQGIFYYICLDTFSK